MDSDFKCTLVIPTRNSGKTLRTTLKAVFNGEYLPDELLIIDGLSTDDTVDIAKSMGVRVITNQKIHVAGARQLGTVSARFPLIVFVDSDCIPAPDWLKKIVENFRQYPDLDGVGGKVFISNPINKVQKYSASVFESIMQFPNERQPLIKKSMYGTFPGANCAFRKSAILSIGGFRDFFSNHAEEVDLVWRMIDEGKKLVFDPTIIVDHLDYPDSVRNLMRTNFNYGIASTKLAKLHIGYQIDTKLYGSLLNSFISGLNPFNSDKTSWLRFLQIGTFIFGKIYSSIAFWTINL